MSLKILRRASLHCWIFCLVWLGPSWKLKASVSSHTNPVRKLNAAMTCLWTGLIYVFAIGSYSVCRKLSRVLGRRFFQTAKNPGHSTWKTAHTRSTHESMRYLS